MLVCIFNFLHVYVLAVFAMSLQFCSWNILAFIFYPLLVLDLCYSWFLLCPSNFSFLPCPLKRLKCWLKWGKMPVYQVICSPSCCRKVGFLLYFCKAYFTKNVVLWFIVLFFFFHGGCWRGFFKSLYTHVHIACLRLCMFALLPPKLFTLTWWKRSCLVVESCLRDGWPSVDNKTGIFFMKFYI